MPARWVTRTVLGVLAANVVVVVVVGAVGVAVGVRVGVVERTRTGVEVDRARFGFSGVETRVKEDMTVVSVTCGMDWTAVDGGSGVDREG